MPEIIVLLLVILIVGSLAYGALSAAPWLPLRRQDIKRLLDLAQSQPDQLLYDLGCGDGRIISAAVRGYQLRARGYEIAILPFIISRIKIWLAGLTDRAEIKFSNFWKIDLSEADIVVCFLTPSAMVKLLPKLQTELKPGARFITYAFPLPGIEPDTVSKPLTSDINIYLYTKIVRPVGKLVDI